MFLYSWALYINTLLNDLFFYILFIFLLALSSVQAILLPHKTWLLFTFFCMHVVYAYINCMHITHIRLIICMFFRANHLVLGNQLVALPWGRTPPLLPNFSVAYSSLYMVEAHGLSHFHFGRAIDVIFI